MPLLPLKLRIAGAPPPKLRAPPPLKLRTEGAVPKLCMPPPLKLRIQGAAPKLRLRRRRQSCACRRRQSCASRAFRRRHESPRHETRRHHRRENLHRRHRGIRHHHRGRHHRGPRHRGRRRGHRPTHREERTRPAGRQAEGGGSALPKTFASKRRKCSNRHKYCTNTEPCRHALRSCNPQEIVRAASRPNSALSRAMPCPAESAQAGYHGSE